MGTIIWISSHKTLTFYWNINKDSTERTRGYRILFDEFEWYKIHLSGLFYTCE